MLLKDALDALANDRERDSLRNIANEDNDVQEFQSE